MSDLFADLERWHDALGALGRPVSYIVLDPSCPPGRGFQDGDDANGRRYLMCSSALLDEFGPPWTGPDDPMSMRLMGTCVYRREDMPDGWPGGVKRLLCPSECGHTQGPPTDDEINGCPEIIVRACEVCGCELLWRIAWWRKVIHG